MNLKLVQEQPGSLPLLSPGSPAWKIVGDLQASDELLGSDHEEATSREAKMLKGMSLASLFGSVASMGDTGDGAASRCRRSALLSVLASPMISCGCARIVPVTGGERRWLSALSTSLFFPLQLFGIYPILHFSSNPQLPKVRR